MENLLIRSQPCPECGTDFEVVTANPVELKPVEEEIEDEEEEEEADGDYS